jgi:hypothetical protein
MNDAREARARGYTNMFLNWHDSAMCKVLERASFTKIRNTKNRNKFIKLSEALVKAGIKNYTLNYLSGGTKRHPFILFTQYCDANFTHSNYDERVIMLSSRFFPFNNIGFVKDPWPITISFHTIQRLFQRSDVIDLNSSELNLFDNGKVVNEMKYISLWANMWMHFEQKVFKKCPIELEDILMIPIPGEFGLFIAKYTRNEKNKQGYHINVRTYYGYKELEKKGQIEFHKNLKNVSLNLNNSLLCWQETKALSPAIFVFDILIFNFRFKELLDVTIPFMIEDTVAQAIVKNNFIKFFNKVDTKFEKKDYDEFNNFSNNLSEILNKVGYSKYISAVMKIENKTDDGNWLDALKKELSFVYPV